jgi:hypothetical protein
VRELLVTHGVSCPALGFGLNVVDGRASRMRNLIPKRPINRLAAELAMATVSDEEVRQALAVVIGEPPHFLKRHPPGAVLTNGLHGAGE